jgi:DNA invertase Pin-like site-specific DNA recombinase
MSPMMNSTRRAAIYCRISQDRGGAGLGVARQEEDCRALCPKADGKPCGWGTADSPRALRPVRN